MRVKNCHRFEGCGGGVLPKIACNLLKIRVTTSKKQSHSRPRPPPQWWDTPSPFPPFCCKYAAGPPGLVPDLLKRWPRWCAGSDHHPEPPPLVPSCCPPSVAGGGVCCWHPEEVPRCWWWCSWMPEPLTGCRGGALVLMDARTATGCRGGALVVVFSFIYNKVETEYNLFINVKYSIKYEFILFFVW